MEPTPTTQSLPLRLADFANLAEALDYAAKGDTGANFYKKDGQLKAVLPYEQLRADARKLARRLLSLKLQRGARVALVAETDPNFLRFFFACQYAGLVPVPLPISVHLGGSEAFVAQLHRLLKDCRADIAVAHEDYLPFLKEATLCPIFRQAAVSPRDRMVFPEPPFKAAITMRDGEFNIVLIPISINHLISGGIYI